jgi:hypothetical protein
MPLVSTDGDSIALGGYITSDTFEGSNVYNIWYSGNRSFELYISHTNNVYTGGDDYWGVNLYIRQYANNPRNPSQYYIATVTMGFYVNSDNIITYRSRPQHNRGTDDYTMSQLVASVTLNHPKWLGRFKPHDPSEVLAYSNAIIADSKWPTYTVYTGSSYSNAGRNLFVQAQLPSAPLSSLLILDEETLLFEGGISMKPYAAVKLKALRQDAYLDALDHVPQLNENLIANVLEVVTFLKALIFEHRIEIPNSLQSLWLSYRYAYTTTKLDMQEAINFVYRHVDKEFLERGFACYGTTIQEIDGVPITCRCHISVKQKELEYVDTIFSALYRYGLSPSFYVIWDMIPYSFIVDWFIPVGDILSGYDKTHMYDRDYNITDVWYSLKYQGSSDGLDFQAYTRWTDEGPPEFQGYYSLINKGTTSNKVIGFRILDAASLLIR